jgi:UTP--glucose-1-phosphate uridylyltransferase
MQEVFKENKDKCIVAVEEVNIEDVEKYGVISFTSSSNNVFQVDEMIEKPSPKDAPSNLAIIGRYILTPDIFEILENTPPDHNGEIQITNALRELAKIGKVIAYKFKGKRFDCGSLEGYVNANVFFSDLKL